MMLGVEDSMKQGDGAGCSRVVTKIHKRDKDIIPA